MFSNDEGNAVTFQALGVALFILSAAMFFITAPLEPITLAPIDTVMLFSVLLSYLAAAFSQHTDSLYSFMHTTIFLFAYVSVIVIAQRTTAEELVMCIRVSTILILAMVIVVFGGTLLTSLMPGALNRWELREAPFGMHPNLAGFVYGGFLVMAASSGLNAQRYNRLLTSIIIALCLAVMVVASARGGLSAVLITLAVYVMTEVLRARRSVAYIFLIGIALFVLSFVYWDHIVAYGYEMFDLESQERGFQSGGTGRFQIWERGIEFIMSRTWEIFIGSGMRTSQSMGFPVESSYINLAFESGIILAAIILITFLRLLVYCYRQQAKGSAFHRLAFYTLLFAIFQSIFNRYLIAIGNPLSLLVLVIASKASRRFLMRAKNPTLRLKMRVRRREMLSLPSVRSEK
jgi:hypothetical protein